MAKGVKVKNAEEVRFSAFSQWCTNTKENKATEIAEGEAKMEQLAAQIEKAAMLIRKLTERIQELDEDVSRWDRDQESASTVRAAEKADYTATNQDYTESIAAVGQALEVLQKQEADRAQGFVQESLLQVRRLRLVSQRSKNVLDSFLDQ